ncbi:hypothetical protein KY362_06700 [Candidatus Woesearchaeota archaeon]|nr:hypothetical protein [Candidatus Woesearchaeota archaeon]
MKPFKKSWKVLLIAALLTIILTGCTQQAVPERKQTVKDSPEDVLLREIADGKLVEVYDEYVRLGPGETKENWMIISNVQTRQERFSIEPCTGCSFDTESVVVPSGEYKIIGFDVSAKEGQSEIRVKDSRNNAYGYAKISVIVE